MFTLADVKPAKGSVKKKKREGRGHAGYGGKTAGKGMNGQKSRKSPNIREQFEGGQTPMYRRIPKKQYMPKWNKLDYTILNLDDLESLVISEGTEITPCFLLEKKFIKNLEKGGLKILGRGELKKAIKIKANAFSKAAEEKIKKSGGSIERINK